MSTLESQPEVQMKKSEMSVEHLENDPRFLRRIDQARASLLAEPGVPLEEIED